MNKHSNNLQKKTLVIILIVVIIVISLFVSSAFFIINIDSKEQQVNIQIGNLSLIFSDSNNGFDADLEFGSSATKTFSLKNEGTKDAVAKINWKNLVNTYLEESLTYTLTYQENEQDAPIEVISNQNIPTSTESTTLELANGLVVPAGKTYTLTLTITLNYLESIDQTGDLTAILKTEFSIEEGVQPESLVSKLLRQANDVSITDYNSGDKGEMFTFTHPEATQTTGWTEEERIDYRYIGNTPNNYINFNEEIWRIIGVFTVEGENGEKEQRIKIIRDESLGNTDWDDKPSTTMSNEWPTSTLATLLNTGDYYDRQGTYETTGLNAAAKSQIVASKWYLGGSATYDASGQDYYNFERGETAYTSSRSTNVVAKVGLMYPSDYLYTYANRVDNQCFTKGYNCDSGTPSAGWLFNSLRQWTITPYSSHRYRAFYVETTGFIRYDNVNITLGVRPCVYLRSDIEIIGGDGSSKESAYILKS